KLHLNGLAIRGFNDRNIYASFNEHLKAALSLDGAAMGIEIINGIETVVVEKLSHFYQPVRIGQIPWVKDIEKEAAEDMYFNELKTGPTKWNTETINN